MSDIDENEGSVGGSPEKVLESSKKRKDWSPGDKKHEKSKRIRGIDDEAAQSDDGNSGNESSDGESEEEDDTQYVEDGFLVRDDADSDSDDSENENDEEEVQKKKQLQRLKKRKEDFRLDEEDEQLIREYEASKSGVNATEARRVDGGSEIIPEVRKRSGSGQSNDDADSDGEAEIGGGGGHGKDGHREKQHAYYDDEEEGSDMGGFIVDEDEEGDGSQDEGGTRRRNRSGSGGEGQRVAPHRRTGRREGPTYDQLQEAMDIFGAGFDDFSDEEEENQMRESDGENEDGEGAVAGSDWDPAAVGADDRLSKKAQKSIGKLRSRYERSVIVSTFSTERDDTLRRVDRPERMQMALVGRETPQDEERRLEAKWMAKKLAARMIADGHLDSSRSTVYSTANPVAAYTSPLYSMSDYLKEETLAVELVEPICQVLRFMQVDKLEVPFIWAYRRDYQHPVMTREHLWYIFALEEEWDAQVDRKVRLGEEVAAVADAANAFQGSAEEGEEALAQVQGDIHRVNMKVQSLESDLRLAEAEVQAALDRVDELDEPSSEDRQRVVEANGEVERLQPLLQEASERLHRLQEEEAAQRARLQRRSRYVPAIARETVRLFPADRYLSIVRSSIDDQEINDVVQFFRLIAQNSEAAVSGGGEVGGIDGADAANPLSKKANRLRRNDYARYKNNEQLRQFIELIYPTAHNFGDALRHGFHPEIPPTLEATCEEQAQQVVDSGAGFKSAQQVLRAARLVIGTELAMEPSVKGFVRNSFKRLATVSTLPTAKGRATITPFHELFGIHYLREKPLQDFYKGADRSLFLRLAEAERDGLISISIDLPKVKRIMHRTSTDGSGDGSDGVHEVELVDIGSFLKEVVINFMPTKNVSEDPHPTARMSWDQERLMCLQAVVDEHFAPSLQAEVRRELVRVGKEAIVQQASANFAGMLAVGPYIPPYQDIRERTKDILRACPNRPFYGTVAAIFVSLGRNEPLCMAFVNKDGVLRAHDLIPAQAMNQKDERIKRFLIDNRPDLVVINSSGAAAARSTAVVIEKSILKEVEEEVKRREFARREGRMEGISYADDEDEFVPYKAQVMVIKDELPRIFMNSPRSKEMFSDLQPGEAAAVCLARFAQEPLAEYCSAWKAANSQEVFGHELLFLKVHPHVDLLRGAKQALLNALEHRLVDAVCDVGVDVNKACTYDHLAPMLAFVGGLGLRKADALRQNIRKGAKAISSRSHLLLRKLLGKVVWSNAAGFLRVCGEHVDDPFDNTRIHPECYSTFDFATKICADALEVVHSNSDYITNVEKLMATSRRVLEKRMDRHRRWLDLWENGQRPIPGVTVYDELVHTADGRSIALGVELTDMLSQLELDDYAAELEASGLGKRRLLFEQIKDELRFPFLDLRVPLASWTPQEMFFLLSNQTDRSVYVGMKVGGTVIDVTDESVMDERSGECKRRQRAVVQTEAGLRGFISMYDAVDTPSDRSFSFENFNLSSLVYVGKHIEAVVVSVKKEKMQLDLSIKPSLLERNESWWMSQRTELRQARDWWVAQGKDPERLFDPCFWESEALRVCREEEQAQALSVAAVNQQLIASSVSDRDSNGGLGLGPGGGLGVGSGGGRGLMRVVHHPLFANLDFKGAEERMRIEGKGTGEVLIRPSSKGPNYLTITWAFQDNWYKHISVEERGKRPGDLGVGPQLFVQESDMTEAFNDLDELFSNYIVPMNDLVSVVINNRSFNAGTPAEVEALMFAQRAENPQRIPYFLRFEPDKPGVFALTWLSLNLKSEQPVKTLRVEVRPHGLKVMDQYFVRPSDLIMWFKETKSAEAAKAAQEASAARRNAAARAKSSSGPTPSTSTSTSTSRAPAAAADRNEPIRRSRFHD